MVTIVSSQEHPARLYGAWHLYFYVPRGTEIIGGFSEGEGDLLDPAQVRELPAFYKTPTGQKLVLELHAMKQEVSAGQQHVMEKHFSAGELKEITAFYQTPAAQRLQAIAPEKPNLTPTSRKI